MKTSFALVGLILLVGEGCATTTQQKVEQSPAVCGFLGEDVCSELNSGSRQDPSLRYVNPGGAPTQYNKVQILVVGFFGSNAAKVQPKDEQRLTDIFYKNLYEALSKKYEVVEDAGPGVVKVEVALLDAEAATPGARSVTMVVPQLRVLSTGYALAAGKYPFSGGGQAAVKFSDSMSGQVLGAGVDRRAGGGSVKTAAQWQWGDAENAIKAWSSTIANGMYAYTSGQKKP